MQPKQLKNHYTAKNCEAWALHISIPVKYFITLRAARFGRV